MEPAGLAILIISIVLFLLSWILSKSILIVHQAEGVVLERIGRFHKVCESGLNFLVPFLDQPRSFTWRKTYINPNGHIIDEARSSTRIDLRESVFNFLRQEVYTKDTILLDVNSLMYYRITDIKKAIYEVEDLQAALSNTAQTQLKEVFGNMTFSEALQSQNYINEHLRRDFAKLFSAWGIHVERMELLDMMPKQATSEVMKSQMVAERDRRGEFIRSEGKKAAMRLRAEGTKIVKFNLGIAEQEATRKRSEGEAGARVELARAESQSLQTIAEAITADGASQTEFMVAQRFMDVFRRMVDSVESKVIYLPYEVSYLGGLVNNLPQVFGYNAAQRVPDRKSVV